MRKLVFVINITLDGCVDHASQEPDDEAMAFFTQLTRDAGTQVLGRKTYELMVPYWPEVERDPSSSNADMEFARAFNALEKVVFSRSMNSVEEANTQIVNADLRDEILRLKQQDGGDILVGGVDLPSQLVRLGLIDEFLFIIAPIIAGQGRRLFDDVVLPERPELRLVESKTFASGRVIHRYATE